MRTWMQRIGLTVLSTVAFFAAPGQLSLALDIVKDGQPLTAIYCYEKPAETKPGAVYDDSAAADLAKYIGKISGTQIEVKSVAAGQKAATDGPAIIVGTLAIDMGLPKPPETISGDGYRIQTKGNLLLLAGETPNATFFAASHLLQTLGCRWFFDNPIGEVVPEMKTISIDKLDVSEKPDFASRSCWGPNWGGNASWAVHNRLGGLPISTGHDWGHVPPAKYAQEHPEYYALRGDKRVPGNWVCTSNPDVARIFAEDIAGEVKDKGYVSVSLSPPDGTSYCQCEKCTALDDPTNVEASSGRTAMSDRYQLFFNAIGEQVLKVNPKALLNYYAYADYSIPPKHAPKAPENLCAWVAPLRFCRLHSLSNPNCESRQRCRQVVEGWAKVVSKTGWREYNYEVAEGCVPFSKISVWRDDIPFMKKQGCLGLNIECLAFWHIYGPHTYLVTQLAWNANADVDAVMDDFYTKFCGKAAPHVKAYWERIDKAVRETHTHAGSFYSIHTFWTAETVAASEADLDAAAKAADNDLIGQRIAMFRMGLDNAKYYLAIRDATNRCDFKTAKEALDKWLAHMDKICAAGIHRIAEYKNGYAPRFLAPTIDQGFVRTTGDCKLLVQLPDEWLFRYDQADEGKNAGWQNVDVKADGWKLVKTYSATLNEQGIPEILTSLWYRTQFKAPAQLPQGPIHLWFGEIDGRSIDVYLNGELIGTGEKRRAPNEVDISGKLRPDKDNVVAVKIDHSSITELMLGGIIKPVMIYSGEPGRPGESDKEDED